MIAVLLGVAAACAAVSSARVEKSCAITVSPQSFCRKAGAPVHWRICPAASAIAPCPQRGAPSAADATAKCLGDGDALG
jgi:hypothetical protein